MSLRKRRPDLPEVLAGRIIRVGDLRDLLTDVVLRQDMRWVEDQMAGRKSAT